ncbi:hypothetical protein HID58_056275 [Brassica napus]|uniref:Uncharacterized protein n=1 Tax=Brassica napus TaxID=3708 RepID=A0ABQ8AMR9_BRANA|nr:hypothetical protein HID58_056275 [Brassica napus]
MLKLLVCYVCLNLNQKTMCLNLNQETIFTSGSTSLPHSGAVLC